VLTEVFVLWRWNKRLTNSEKAPASHSSEKPSNDEHRNVNRASQQCSTNEGEAGAVDHASLSSPFVHDIAHDENTKECTSLLYSEWFWVDENNCSYLKYT
jgi:hypothetical protein